MYYCEKCGHKHREDSKIGKEHKVYAREKNCEYCQGFKEAGYLYCLHCGKTFPNNRKEK
ncbi:MAG: hypothetical protein ACLFVP_02885 [Candidatus Bathyarchaeia archaeon]